MKSLWADTVNLPTFPTLDGEIKTDVLIVGGGIAGILTAFYLSKAGINYILVEKDRICSGNTQNTTAKITIQHGLIYNKILSSHGEYAAKTYLSAMQEAFCEYEKICKTVNCDFEYKDNYVYSFNRTKLEKELESLQSINYDAQYVKHLALPIKTAGAVKFSNQAQFHPLKFIKEISKGLNIYENTFVQEIRDNVVITDKGQIKAEKIIVATHFPFINKHGSYFLKLYQHRSYVLALCGVDKIDGMYVDEDKKGLSFRNYGEYLLLGGGSHRTGKIGGNWQELRNFSKQHFPKANEKYFWAAQDCMSLDSIPYIGLYSKNTPNILVTSGFNKWGMTGAMLSAILLRDIILNKSNNYADVFSPSRSILQPQLFINGFETITNFCSITKKRCPHLGCALKWNKTENSWDCPCHGSRFDNNGKVLDNPANDK